VPKPENQPETMPDIESTIVKQPLIFMFLDDKDEGNCLLYPTQDNGYEVFGLLICDLVRHVARCFKVDEEDVFAWIEKERHKPTGTISGETFRFREGGSTEAPYTEAENYNRISEDISLQGWALQGVLGNESRSHAMHTIGNHQLGLPELLMLGDNRIAPILNAVCEVMRKNNRPFRQDELIDLGAVFPLRILNDEATKCFTQRVGNYYGTNDYDVQLILMPDIFGRYPDEPDKPLVFGSSVGRVEG
jgi:hypothetical protein